MGFFLRIGAGRGCQVLRCSDSVVPGILDCEIVNGPARGSKVQLGKELAKTLLESKKAEVSRRVDFLKAD